MSHFIKICIRCGDVINQCRCMDCNKTVSYSICNQCRRETTDERDSCEEVEETGE